QVDAQRAAIGHRPCTVEVEDAGKHARIVVAKSVPMAAVACARRVKRIMSLEREKTDKSRLVERKAQLFEHLPQGALGRSRRMSVEPQRPVAAEVAAPDTIRSAPDSRGAEIAHGIATTSFLCQRQADRRRQEIRNYRDPIGGKRGASIGNDPVGG